MPGDHDTHLLCFNQALGGLNAGDFATALFDGRDLALLNDVDATFIGAAGETPSDCVVAGRAAATL